jgi:hypothetical protein
MMAPATIADEPYWMSRHAAGDRSMAVTNALAEIAQANEAKAVDDMIFHWLSDLILDDHLAELDRSWKGAR